MVNKIGVFDSGIGGLSILNELKKVLLYEDFYYYGDSKNNPYGEKSDEELFEIVSSVVEKLIDNGCKLIVIACNTATTRCMKKLRETYKDIIFVGTVPAIKVACDQRFKNTLVMATPATIESERTYELIRDNKRYDQKIYLLACPGLARAIEDDDKEKIKEILRNDFKDYKDKNIDSIVLGCTHYPFIKKEILEEMPGVSLIDGSVGVAKEVKRQL
ncbi:MAG: glutamate racemase, partial [Tenericutes bacterium]|nr:glutamate racemase [Mycoplasmatota bacterium]